MVLTRYCLQSPKKLQDRLFAEPKVRVLNVDMEWRDSVRSPNAVVLDLLSRLRRIVEDNASIPSAQLPFCVAIFY